jgi:acetyltransferase-like isoleucine patch superfamily enzyme
LEYPVALRQPEEIEIGSNVVINEFVHIWGAGGVRIGDRVMIGSNSAITSVTHDYNSEIMYTTVVKKQIVIGNDVWIGTHAVILPGVTVGDGAVVGAGAVVTSDVPPRAIVAGVPSRVLAMRPSQVSLAGTREPPLATEGIQRPS